MTLFTSNVIYDYRRMPDDNNETSNSNNERQPSKHDAIKYIRALVKEYAQIKDQYFAHMSPFSIPNACKYY